MAIHNDLGKQGEALAVDYLQKNGYTICATNWRYLKAEIDIIAQKGNTLAIVEVKTRTINSVSTPEEAVNQKKIQLLVTAADTYVVENNLDVDVRFDIIAVLKNKNAFSIEHTEEAFLFF